MAIARTGVYVDDYLECENFALPLRGVSISFLLPPPVANLNGWFVFEIVQTRAPWPATYRGSSPPCASSTTGLTVTIFYPVFLGVSELVGLQLSISSVRLIF
jgi:hypothetical protein